MIQVIHRAQVLRRLPIRRSLLAYLNVIANSSSAQSFGLYRTLDYPRLRRAKPRYPKRRSTMLLLAAAGTVNPVTVPNVVGLQLSAALPILGAANILPTPITYQNDPSAAGIVLAQSIPPGSAVVAGEPMGLIVSLGAAPTPGFRVEAVTAGMYRGLYYQPGDVFDIFSSADFSDANVNYEISGNEIAYGWMRQVPSSTPLYRQDDAELSPDFPQIDPNRRFTL